MALYRTKSKPNTPDSMLVPMILLCVRSYLFKENSCCTLNIVGACLFTRLAIGSMDRLRGFYGPPDLLLKAARMEKYFFMQQDTAGGD